MIISICKTLKLEFLMLKPYFKYCFSKDKRKGAFKEYNFNTKNMCLKEQLEYTKKYNQFQELNRKETLKLSIQKIGVKE